MWKLLIFVNCLITSLCCGNAPEVVTDVVSGKEVTLSCAEMTRHLDASDDVKLMWSNPKNDILYAGGKAFLINNRITLLQKYEDGRPRYDLHIKNVNENDAGEYNCRYYADEQSCATKVILRVQVPPKFVDISHDVVTVDEGSSEVLICKVKGKPQPQVSWRFIMPQVNEMRNAGEHYFLNHVTRKRDGRYVCSADNGVGDVIQHEIKLTVRYAPEIVRDEGSRAVTDVVLGNKSSFKCVGRGEPSPEFKWLLPSNQIVNERDKERFTSIKREQKRVISTLHIKRVMTSDIGKAFICIATNKLGSTNQTFKFRALPPLPPTRMPPYKFFPSHSKLNSANIRASMTSLHLIFLLLHLSI